MITTKQQLEEFATCNWNAINSFIDGQFKGLPVPIYSSVDIRESKEKIAPIDHNMYPAGFNNICNRDLEACSQELRATISKLGSFKTVGILTESHTRNPFYLDHLAILGKMVGDAGFEAHLLSFDENLFEQNDTLPLISFSKFDVLLHKARIIKNEVFIGEESIDIVILNNDQSAPIALNWETVKTPIVPSPHVGWFRRDKILYFTHYSRIVKRFADHFDIDPNLIEAKFTGLDKINFSTKEGMDTLASTVDHFSTYIPKGSGIFVKAARGTYGMGISVVRNGGDIVRMNRRSRNKMDIGKNKIKFTSLLIQEGLKTVLEYDGMPAEVSIYLINGKGLGGFMRANSLQGDQDNLNSRGSIFKKYCISEIREGNKNQYKESLYSIVARLATLAAALETKEILKTKKGA